MKQLAWEIVREKMAHSGTSYRSQRALERRIVAACASEQDLSYEAAERKLANESKILNFPSWGVENVYLLQSPVTHSPSEEEIRQQQLRDFMDLGERAISAFERTRAYRIHFPHVFLNDSLLSCWLGNSLADATPDFQQLSDQYRENQDRFQFLTAEKVPKRRSLAFTFGYQKSKRRKSD